MKSVNLVALAFVFLAVCAVARELAQAGTGGLGSDLGYLIAVATGFVAILNLRKDPHA